MNLRPQIPLSTRILKLITRPNFESFVYLSIWIFFCFVQLLSYPLKWLWCGSKSAVRLGIEKAKSKPQYERYHTVPQIIALCGYVCRTHVVTTDDGYQLTLFQLSSPKADHSKKRPVALLWHGLLDSAYTWVYLEKNALPFALCDIGYDVWLGNNRGNVYSCGHAFMNRSSSDYWRFTFDEFVSYDLPNSIDYILEQAGVDKLSYIGHSEGTTQMFGMLSVCPQRSRQLNSVTFLGPVISVTHVKGVFRAMAMLRIDQVFWKLGWQRQFAASFKPWVRWILSQILIRSPVIVDDVLRILCGQPVHDMDASHLSDWVEHEPAGTSVMNLAHWAQGIRLGPDTASTRQFRMFDFGTQENMRRYGQETPPLYPVFENYPQTLPTLMCCGTTDTLANPTDAKALIDGLRAGKRTIDALFLQGYNHTDFLWATEAPSDLFPVIIKFVELHNPPPSEPSEGQLSTHDLDWSETEEPDTDVLRK